MDSLTFSSSERKLHASAPKLPPKTLPGGAGGPVRLRFDVFAISSSDALEDEGYVFPGTPRGMRRALLSNSPDTQPTPMLEIAALAPPARAPQAPDPAQTALRNAA